MNDANELELIASIEKGEWKPLQDNGMMMNRLKKAASGTASKDYRMKGINTPGQALESGGVASS